MGIAVDTNPLNHMNPRTRGFKVNGIYQQVWGAEILGQTSLMTTPFHHPTTIVLESATSINERTQREPSILIPNRPVTFSLQPSHNSLANLLGNPQLIMQVHFGTLAKKKRRT